jgi:glycosyltransferase involved in cell wall biosynthesis
LTAKILVECHHLTSRSGTGLATYARNLARAAAFAGHPTASLFGIRTPLPPGPGPLRRVHLFDTPPATTWSPRHAWLKARNLVMADRHGVEAEIVRPDPMVVDPGSFLGEPYLAEAHVVVDLARRARRHFRRYRRLLPVRTDGIDLLHASHVIPLRLAGGPTLATIHDIIPLRLPYSIREDKPAFFGLIEALLNQADHIVTVSEHSRRDIVQFFRFPEDRITNTGQAVAIEPEFLAKTEEEVAFELETVFGLEWKEYWLFAGAIEPKKNVRGLLEGYQSSGSSRPLILAGGLGWQYEDDLRRIHDRRFKDLHVKDGKIRRERRVRHVKYVPRHQLLALMRGARGLVFPSFYEGFGLPVLEAMMLGTPVITSNTSSLPEIAGDAALFVNPYDSGSIGEAIRRLDYDPGLRAELGRKGIRQAEAFSPAHYAQRLAALYARFA